MCDWCILWWLYWTSGYAMQSKLFATLHGRFDLSGNFPFLGLLNSSFPDHHGYKAMVYSILGGCIASLPSVNIRPCINNVNPPESRGTALTAANLVITLGRGIGPSCITIVGSFFHRSNPRLPRYCKPNLPVFGPASVATESPTCGTHLLDP